MSDSVYHLAINQQSIGPFTAEEIRQQQQPGSTPVWKTGMTDWATLDTLPEFQPEETTTVPPPLTQQPGLPAYFLFGSLMKDLNTAALCGLGGTVAYFFDQLIDIGMPGFVLFSLSEVGFLWGLWQTGQRYQLRWVRRGASLLILASLLGWLSAFGSGFVASAASWLTVVLSAVGTIVAFVDLWALRTQLNQRLVTAVVVGHIIAVFLTTLPLTSQSVFELLEATNAGLLAWLFYDIIARNDTVQLPATTLTPA